MGTKISHRWFVACVFGWLLCATVLAAAESATPLPKPLADIAALGKAGQIELAVPTKPTAATEMAVINMTGVPIASLPKLQYWVWPTEGIQLIAGQGLRANDPPFLVFRPALAGTYKFIVVAPDGQGDLLTATQVIIVNPPGPIPPGPNPPVPPVPPVPPTPQKLRVLLLYDAAKLDKMPEQQQQIIFSVAHGSLREYLDTHTLTDTVSDASGGKVQLPAKRIWPVNVDPEQAGTLWKPLLTAAEGKPSIVVQSGTTVQRFDLPATNDEAVKLLVPYGGN